MWNFEHSYIMSLPEKFYRRQEPLSAPLPSVLLFNEPLAKDLGLSLSSFFAEPDAKVFSGDVLPQGANPIAQAYAGFQFGHFNMLGDGRALLLGEHITPNGARFDIQLKGSGPTDFARGGDGLAAVGPMLREYIISEYMAAVGIPTTRSLAVALTGRGVVRQPCKNAEPLKAAVLTRVASSHIRVGTFDFARAYGDLSDLKALADYVIWRHFPEINDSEIEPNPNSSYLLLFHEIAKRQGALIARWMLAGFIHGVMNTDNMAVSGETIDYGPCAFMDNYDPATVFSFVDTHGRYAYKNQPRIAAWNLSRLAEALLPLISENGDEAISLAEEGIKAFWDSFNGNWLIGMMGKLGISEPRKDDVGLVSELLELMAVNGLDYTDTFRSLNPHEGGLTTALPRGAPLQPLEGWVEKWRGRIKDSKEAAEIMQECNPAVIPRNHKVEEALSAAEQGDITPAKNLIEALRQPYRYSEIYSEPPKESLEKYVTYCGT
jgi:uncharacterized protein YdiU (UPF0061 family)